MGIVPPGEPGAVRAQASQLAQDAGSLAQLRSELHAEVTQVLGGWQGEAAQAFSRHMEHPAIALGLLEDALNGTSRAASSYAYRLEAAQQKYREALRVVSAAGLRMANDYTVDPTSVGLPPDLGKVAAAARAEGLIVEAEREGAEAAALLARDLAAPLVSAERAALEVAPDVREGIKVGLDGVRSAIGATLTSVERRAHAAAVGLTQVVQKAEATEKDAERAVAAIQRQLQELPTQLRSKQAEVGRGAPWIERGLRQLEKAVPGAERALGSLARRLGLDPTAGERAIEGFIGFLRGAARQVPSEADYLQRAAALGRWFEARSTELNRALQAATAGLATAQEEVARLRPLLQQAEEFAQRTKLMSIAGKAGGLLLVVPAMKWDYEEFYAHSHDPKWSTAYAAEDLIPAGVDVAADLLIASSVIVGPEAAVVGIGVAVVGMGAAIGAQCITRYVYDHQAGFSRDPVAATVQTAKDFGTDAKQSWDLLPVPGDLKAQAALNPVLAPFVEISFIGSLLAHSKGWI